MTSAKGVSLDGGMMNIRQEGWKELMVGTVFDIAMRLEYDEKVNEWAEIAYGLHVDYTAVLGSVEAFAARAIASH
jgi:hypothetical protein